MRYALRTRQGILVAVGAAYIFVLAWFNRQPIPTTALLHESDNSLKLRTTGSSHLGTKNKNIHWLEPTQYLEASDTPGVINLDAGLLHIRLHTEFRTLQARQPLGGLLKVYRKPVQFVKGGVEDAWELLFVDRLPGPVKLTYLDRTRLRQPNGQHAPRRLAVLYYVADQETMAYATRIYDLESLHKAEYFDAAVKRVGPKWWEVGSDAEAAVQATRIATENRLCPDDESKLADSVFAGAYFRHCVGRAGLKLRSVDVGLPGAQDVIEFSLRGTTLLYSRLNDVVRFRVVELNLETGGRLTQTVGPDVSEYLRDTGRQTFLAQLYSTRPGSSMDVFLAHGSTTSDTFYFSFELLQNTTLAKRWIHEDVKRYRLPVHQQFSGLSRDELRLVNDPPLVDQVGLTSVFYFKATDIIVVVDTEWFRDHGSSNVTQLQRVRESRPPYISTLNSPVAVNMTLDESGALLAMSTVDDELFIFARAHVSSTMRILDYRRYFRTPRLMPWVATEPVSSVDSLDEGETDIFNWQLRLTWQPSNLLAVRWDDGLGSPDNPFPNTQRFIPRPHHQSTTTCLRFLHFDPLQVGAKGSDAVIRILALSSAGRLRMWELDSHEQSPHILWPFITEHWGLMFILAAVVSCCVYNERRWG
ncbi:hypothetical protein IWW37_003753 [Coemansia sp. RSA 2050]|nr:hypothetical protein IWW37_003753 [Coemansia sp. RSA 2050]KAJ2732598.1 hypothetical protein IW152_003713 [Coemansia sp. BCRC 34962]